MNVVALQLEEHVTRERQKGVTPFLGLIWQWVIISLPLIWLCWLCGVETATFSLSKHSRRRDVVPLLFYRPSRYRSRSRSLSFRRLRRRRRHRSASPLLPRDLALFSESQNVGVSIRSQPKRRIPFSHRRFAMEHNTLRATKKPASWVALRPAGNRHS